MQQEMKYIYTVYQKGSFSKAAEALFMTQPALSISIQKVENEIGMPLFNRDKKPLELTEAGQLYIEKIRQIMHLENELSQQLNDLTDLKTGQLRIGGSHYFNSYILPPVIADFKKKWPGIDLELTEAGSYELLTMLKDDLIDLTFNCTPDPRQIKTDTRISGHDPAGGLHSFSCQQLLNRCRSHNQRHPVPALSRFRLSSRHNGSLCRHPFYPAFSRQQSLQPLPVLLSGSGGKPADSHAGIPTRYGIPPGSGRHWGNSDQ